MMQYHTDFQQQIRVNESSTKQMVHILACVSHLVGQPSNAAPLPRKFGFDESSDMWRFVRGHDFWFLTRKKRGSYLLPGVPGFPRPLLPTSHPRRIDGTVETCSWRSIPAGMVVENLEHQETASNRCYSMSMCCFLHISFVCWVQR